MAQKLFNSLFVIMASTIAMAIQAAIPVDFSEIVEQVSPAIVSVNVKKAIKDDDLAQQENPELFKRFFGNEIVVPQKPISHFGTALGSGFFISSDGYLITNHHVISDASKVTLILNDRSEVEADIVGSDQLTDIALLKVKTGQYPALKIGNVDQLKVGQPVLAIGSPFGFDYSASAGIVSAKSRTIFNETSVSFIQTDVALNPGNSGGPLFNSQGEVVAVNSRIFTDTGNYMGLSFSVPIDIAIDVINQIKKTGKVTRAYLGVMLKNIDRKYAKDNQYNKFKGVVIVQIKDGSPAQKAELKVGDEVLAFNGKAIKDAADLINKIYQNQINQKIKLTILRQNIKKEISLTLVAAHDEGSRF